MPPVHRGNGNGQRPWFNVRALIKRRLGIPRGPFNVAQVINALESLNYHAEPRAPDEMLMFRHRDREQPIPVDPDWSDFWEASGIFNCIQRVLGISADELVSRLSDMHQW